MLMDAMLFFKAMILVTIINQKNILKEMVPNKICGTLTGRCGREAWASADGMAPTPLIMRQRGLQGPESEPLAVDL